MKYTIKLLTYNKLLLKKYFSGFKMLFNIKYLKIQSHIFKGKTKIIKNALATQLKVKYYLIFLILYSFIAV